MALSVGGVRMRSSSKSEDRKGEEGPSGDLGIDAKEASLEEAEEEGEEFSSMKDQSRPHTFGLWRRRYL